MKRFLLAITVCSCFGLVKAQTPMYTDGLMVPKKDLGNGLFYGHDQWTRFWQGTSRKENGNIGTVTTQSITWMGVYGLTDKISLIATLPYVWTKASSGTLHGMSGVQDVTLAGKYQLLNTDFGKSNVKFFGLIAYSMPASNYAVDLLPLSIGLGTKTWSYRLTGSYTFNQVWFAALSGAYTWRSNVFLDRPAYYSNGQLYSTNEVHMPDVFDFIVRFGYHQHNLRTEVYYAQQNTLGGGDIPGWNVTPLPSFQMNAIKAGASILYTPAKLKNIALRAWGNYAFAGRNVGQSTTLTVGAMYTLHFVKNQ